SAGERRRRRGRRERHRLCRHRAAVAESHDERGQRRSGRRVRDHAGRGGIGGGPAVGVEPARRVERVRRRVHGGGGPRPRGGGGAWCEGGGGGGSRGSGGKPTPSPHRRGRPRRGPRSTTTRASRRSIRA